MIHIFARTKTEKGALNYTPEDWVRKDGTKEERFIPNETKWTNVA